MWTTCAHNTNAIHHRPPAPGLAAKSSPPNGTTTSPGTAASEQTDAAARDAADAATSADAEATSAETTSACVPPRAARVPVPSACVPQPHALVQRVAAPRLRHEARSLVLLLPPCAELLRAVQHHTLQLLILVTLLPGGVRALALALAVAARATYGLAILRHARLRNRGRRGSGYGEATQSGA